MRGNSLQKKDCSLNCGELLKLTTEHAAGITCSLHLAMTWDLQQSASSDILSPNEQCLMIPCIGKKSNKYGSRQIRCSRVGRILVVCWSRRGFNEESMWPSGGTTDSMSISLKVCFPRKSGLWCVWTRPEAVGDSLVRGGLLILVPRLINL